MDTNLGNNINYQNHENSNTKAKNLSKSKDQEQCQNEVEEQVESNNDPNKDDDNAETGSNNNENEEILSIVAESKALDGITTSINEEIMEVESIKPTDRSKEIKTVTPSKMPDDVIAQQTLKNMFGSLVDEQKIKLFSATGTISDKYSLQRELEQQNSVQEEDKQISNNSTLNDGENLLDYNSESETSEEMFGSCSQLNSTEREDADNALQDTDDYESYSDGEEEDHSEEEYETSSEQEEGVDSNDESEVENQSTDQMKEEGGDADDESENKNQPSEQSSVIHNETQTSSSMEVGDVSDMNSGNHLNYETVNETEVENQDNVTHNDKPSTVSDNKVNSTKELNESELNNEANDGNEVSDEVTQFNMNTDFISKKNQQQKLASFGFVQETGDLNEQDKAKSKSKPKKKTVRKQTCTKTNVTFSSTENIHLIPTNQQDDINTVASDETSRNMNKTDEMKMIPPKYIRYRLGVQLDKVISFADILNDDSNNDKEPTPAQRCREIFMELSRYIETNIDPNALFISWKNDEEFSTMKVSENNNFPKELTKVATFFDGYEANIKQNAKIYFKFCLHSPGQFDKRVEKKLNEWRELHGFTLYPCTIQAESSKVIGWLVYSMGFTNKSAIKKVLSAKSSHEWGFLTNVITSTDSQVEWKNRLKAINVLMPTENAESARELLASVFSQKATGNKYRSIEDCYMFVSNERQCQGDKLAPIYSAMVGRHKFRFLHIKTVLVQVIVKDVDTLITTNTNEEVTLCQMILELEPKEAKYGEQKLFHSVDYTPVAKKVWFKIKQLKGKELDIFFHIFHGTRQRHYMSKTDLVYM